MSTVLLGQLHLCMVLVGPGTCDQLSKECKNEKQNATELPKCLSGEGKN